MYLKRHPLSYFRLYTGCEWNKSLNFNSLFLSKQKNAYIDPKRSYSEMQGVNFFFKFSLQNIYYNFSNNLELDTFALSSSGILMTTNMNNASRDGDGNMQFYF